VTVVSQLQRQDARKPKLVRITARLTMSGATRQVCILHEQLAPFFETSLIIGSLAHGEGDMSYLLPSEHDVFRLPEMSREVSVWADFLAFWKILRILLSERPDIVHTHTAKAGALGRLAAWMARVPVVIHTYHGHVLHGYFGAMKSRFYLALERVLGRLSTRLITISDSQLEELCEGYHVAAREKFVVIRNGFELQGSSGPCREDARKNLKLLPSDFVVVWAGRMVPVKDTQLLAQVIRTAAEKRSKICFLVLGDGTERPEFETLIRDCQNVRLLGWQRDMEPIWAAADVALLTSRNEGTPTVLIEAMAAGRPFVSTSVGGVRDLALGPWQVLPDGMGHRAANGYLTSRTPESMLFCIEQIANDPQAALKMASVGRSFVLDRFSARRLVEEMGSLYQTLLAEKRIIVSGVLRESETSAGRTGDTT
jgi:glycosyltransferase involved in cell wall biosynthesis